jgi:hypothetical protein
MSSVEQPKNEKDKNNASIGQAKVAKFFHAGTLSHTYHPTLGNQSLGEYALQCFQNDLKQKQKDNNRLKDPLRPIVKRGPRSNGPMSTR